MSLHGESLLAGFPEEAERLGREQEGVRLNNAAVCLLCEADTTGTSTPQVKPCVGTVPGSGSALFACS